MASPDYEAYECKTLDGTTIRGWLFLVDRRPAPTVIMTPGINVVKEILLPQVAKGFQSQGFNVFIYDTRSVGGSDGSPRNLLDPLQYSEDLSDIITHISTLPSVDSKRIILWGISLGALVSGCTAVVDSRVKAVIMASPVFNYYRDDKRKDAFARLIKDREAQLLHGCEPEMMPMFDSKGENIIGMLDSGGPGGLESYRFNKLIVEKAGPTARNHVAIQSYHNIAMFWPKQIIANLETPVMMIIPGLDQMYPPELQKQMFDKIKSPMKKVLWLKDRGHLNLMGGKGKDQLLREQVGFINDVLGVQTTVSKL
ncbi:hypothetical protein KVR01_012704 [Diaporthe batatas]|uniref:uncharacterized protein n=1 Tax=Diaporthe batatas TaxID=748121 RepID=UPI001D04E2E5|nr:uncharacterized protein KVR01_012704 [Diaporthe batatas]KAG8157320.1 hypothetical protein KVR01_012704 [Diaporthe batatas]